MKPEIKKGISTGISLCTLCSGFFLWFAFTQVSSSNTAALAGKEGIPPPQFIGNETKIDHVEEQKEQVAQNENVADALVSDSAESGVSDEVNDTEVDNQPIIRKSMREERLRRRQERARQQQEQVVHEAAVDENIVEDIQEEDVAPSAPAQVTNEPFYNDFAAWEISREYSISIPELNIHAPIMRPSRKYWDARQWTLMEEQMQVALNGGATAYPNSVEPGEQGSLIVAAHSSPPTVSAQHSAYGNLFAKLPNIEAGDEIVVSNNGQKFIYEVSDMYVVPASATEILAQDKSETVLKLLTCYPVGTTRERFLVVAKPKQSAVVLGN